VPFDWGERWAPAASKSAGAHQPGMNATINPGRWTFTLRLEDAIALLFFFVFLAIRSLSRGSGLHHVGPATDMALVGVIALVVKEIVQQGLTGKSYRASSKDDLKKFAHPFWEIARDWFPFLVILLMYYSLYGDATHLIVNHDRDAALIALDQRFFGCQPSVVLQRFITPALTAWMKFNYSMHLIYIPVVAGFLYVFRPRACFRNMMCGLVTICFFGFLGYLLVPAVGPMFTLKSQYTIPLFQASAIINGPARFMDAARVQRDSFPSMHVAISFLVWIYAGVNSRRLFWALSPFILSLWVSTVYLRYHYLVDCVAGLLLAPACFFLANGLFKRFGNMRVSVALPARLAAWFGLRARLSSADLREESRQPS
jgi:membrane-associated phospholipid phosphatase